MTPIQQCPQCGTMLAEGHASCPGCGLDVRESTRRCDRCDEIIAGDADACPACGHLFAEARCDVHADRPAPGQCALCGSALCVECEAGDRRYHRCAEHADVPIIEGWAQVLSLADEVEARLIEDNLRAEGVDARVLSQKDHSAFPVDLGDLAVVRVLAPTYAFQDAQRIIAAHRDAVGEVSFGCPNCGEPFDEAATVCGACGEALV
jgi:RNA polymerase subunit RPABC4/transcription elongation factor Spt4